MGGWDPGPVPAAVPWSPAGAEEALSFCDPALSPVGRRAGCFHGAAGCEE